ncbi:putative Zn-dependent protease [Streptococcus sp. DD10]|uniref:M57 family metalloprotease n=1 Tax=Streptococcus sp. DD10 TaxID=1777878 RepID=UPI0007935E92|nr:M57 family metalloprotease [Streptococcus sp. DD10]KXT74169.1 putative Zn-dependent protease [Streptococcus sp. DD10]
MIRFIIRFFFGVIHFIWRAIWRLFWSLVILFLVLVTAIYFMRGGVSQGSQGLISAVHTAIQQISRFAGSTDLDSAGQRVTNSLSDSHTEHVAGVRWNQAQATIYIDPNLDETFRQAYEEAISNWNNTGAFNFQIVEDQSSADIIATEMNDSTVTAAGEAQSQTNLLTNRFMSVTVRLNAYYLLNPSYGYTYQRIVNTAEHELGHAIGLDHTEEESVMQSAGSFYAIQAQDIAAVQTLYQD